MTEIPVTIDKAEETATQPIVDDDRIRNRAYELYEKRNGGSGDAESDWYRAEAELRSVPPGSAK